MIDLGNVSWKPAKIGGAIFETTIFEIKSENSLVIRPTKLFKILVPIVVGLLSVIPFLSSIISQKTPSLIIILIVMVFDIIMFIVYLQGSKLIEINKQTDSVKKGLNLKTAKNLKKVSEIKFIQILEESMPTKNSSAVSYSYEINLVYNDHTRLNLTDHSILTAIHENALTLKKFLGCPVYTKKAQTNEIIEVI